MAALARTWRTVVEEAEEGDVSDELESCELVDDSIITVHETGPKESEKMIDDRKNMEMAAR